MKRVMDFFVLFILLSFLSAVPAQPQDITYKILKRIFLIKYKDNSCSSFTIEVGNRQYLVTAKHVFDGIKDGDIVYIFRDEKWYPLKVRPIYCEPSEVDIIVLAVPQQLSSRSPSPLIPSLGGIILSQEVYFLGFPYGIYSTESELTNWFPIPFVKKGILSAIEINPRDFRVIYVDGHNNPGFSGGPIVFKDIKTKELKIAGVISGYQNQIDKVISEIRRKQGGKPKLEETNLIVVGNSGILIGYDIANAIEAIKRNPIGCEIKQ